MSYTNEQIKEIADKYLKDYPKPENYQVIDNFDLDDCTDGHHSLGYGEWIDKDTHININERVDTKLVIIKDNKKLKAIKSSHYHRRGYVGKLTLFINK